MSKGKTGAVREERVLAKPLVQDGRRLEPGARVRLRVDQITRLEADGYFEAADKPAPASRKGVNKDTNKHEEDTGHEG